MIPPRTRRFDKPHLQEVRSAQALWKWWWAINISELNGYIQATKGSSIRTPCDSKNVYQIYCMLVQSRCISPPGNCRSFRGAEAGNKDRLDYVLVLARIRLSVITYIRATVLNILTWNHQNPGKKNFNREWTEIVSGCIHLIRRPGRLTLSWTESSTTSRRWGWIGNHDKLKRLSFKRHYPPIHPR